MTWGIMIPHFISPFNMPELINKNIPRHIAIIMDGNGRWAKNRKLTRTQGHWEGAKRVEELVAVAQAMDIKVLTLYTFSTENWRRPKAEVSVLMKMFANVLDKKIKKLKANNVRFRMIGRKESIPDFVFRRLKAVMDETKDNTGLIMNLAFNYGSRQEIVDGVQSIARAVRDGQIGLDAITEATVSQALYTRDLPDPDLLIRTSGEKRISNFLLWQLSYAELYFTEVLWPDFGEDEFRKAVADYQQRDRRFGKVGNAR